MDLYTSILYKLLFPIGDSIRGIPIQKRYEYLKKSQFYSEDIIRQNQSNDLIKLVMSLENVPYYSKLMKERGISRKEFNGIQKLALFPKLTKELTIVENVNLRARGLDLRDVYQGKTGGSTGEPLTYFHDKETQAYNRACHYRGLSWGNFQWGEPLICLFGGTLGLKRTSVKDIFRNLMIQQVDYPAFEVKTENLKKIQSLFVRVKPKALLGYTSSIYNLCCLLEKNNIEISVPIVFTTGEVLPYEYRDFINNVLNAKVYDYYGFGEIQAVAYQCPSTNNYHLSDEKVILELEPVQEYSNPLIGRALFTDLTNYSFPLIRYEPGDIVELAEKKCACGRNLTTIKRIIGRTHDFIRSSNGKVLPGIFFPHLFSKVPSIRYYQIVQDVMDQITIKYIPLSHNQDIQNEKRTLSQKIREYTSSSMEITFQEVYELPKTPSGKLQVVVSNIDPKKN